MYSTPCTMLTKWRTFTYKSANIYTLLINVVNFRLTLIKDFCLSFIVKDDNLYEIVMSTEFGNLDKPLMVEIIRKRLNPGKITEIKFDKIEGTTLEMDLAVFLKTGGRDFCDINLILDGGHCIPAHKSILSSRCTYFQAMFRSFMPHDNSVKVSYCFFNKFFCFIIRFFHQIQIGDISPSLESFYSLLRYIYYGDKKMPPEDSLYLFQAPCFYGFTNKRLQAFCKHNVEHNIHYDNVLQILEASDKMNLPDIKNYALRMIVQDFAQVASLPKMKELSRDLLLEVIQAVGELLGEIRFNQDFASISIHSDL